MAGFIGVQQDWVVIKSQVASNDASVTFHDAVNGVVFDSTYDEYKWEFIDIHPHEDIQTFGFQVNVAGASGFNEAMTTVAFDAYHGEDNINVSNSSAASMDQVDGDAAYQKLNYSTGNNANQSLGGFLHMFSPSSTTHVKQFMSVTQHDEYDEYSAALYVGGYINVPATAVDEINFMFASGNMSGTITMYGLRK